MLRLRPSLLACVLTKGIAEHRLPLADQWEATPGATASAIVASPAGCSAGELRCPVPSVAARIPRPQSSVTHAVPTWSSPVHSVGMPTHRAVASVTSAAPR